ncbi:hypothetical protein Tco_0656170 [Tanacetum coccineum]|uniref:Uncharacterized protein n=1 Tax=Tanacetum coccineum TaxID=301880 RepID=A0ABQ4X877_9ASTR
MDFLEFYKELEAEYFGAGAKLTGIQLLQLELRLGKTPSRSFRPVKSAENLWQFWTSYSLRVSLVQDGSWSNPIWSKNCTGFAIGERYLPIESIIASRSTDVVTPSIQLGQRKGPMVLRRSTITQIIENDSKRGVLRKFHSFE